MDQKLVHKLKKREEEGTMRSLSSYEGLIDFISNDYLGLSSVGRIRDYEASTGSRLISGNHTSMMEAEYMLSLFFGWDAALCFNSGYDANLALFSTIPQKGDIVLYDEFIHASSRDGLRMSHAKSYSFQHNDVNDLKRLLEKFKGETIYVAVETLYSMGGDLCLLNEIASLCTAHGAYLIVDEAHSAGLFGDDGRGYSSECGVDHQLLIKLITFGKAYGSHGACVLCSQEMKTFLVNFARPFIYSTALPLHEYTRMKNVVRRRKLSKRRERLRRNIDYFRSLNSFGKMISDDRSPIQIIQLEDKDQLKQLEERLLDNELAVKLIHPPTVPAGEECIRICIHSFNSKTEIERLTTVLNGFEDIKSV